MQWLKNKLVRKPGRLKKLWRNQAGQDMIEYALMAAVVAVASAAALPGLSGPLSTVLSRVSSVLSGAAAS